MVPAVHTERTFGPAVRAPSPRAGTGAVLAETFGELWRWARAPARRRRVALLALALLLAVGYSAYRAERLRACDLVHGYLGPARGVVFEGKEPRDYPFSSLSPFFYAGVALLAPLPDWLASGVWSLFSLAALAGTMGLVRAILARTLRPSRPLSLAWAVGLATPLVLDNLFLGQSNLFALFFTTCALHELVIGRQGRAGAWLGVAIAWKLTPGVFLLYLALKRRWRALFASLGCLAVCLILVPVAVFGPARGPRFTAEWAGRIVAPVLTGERLEAPNIRWYHTNQSLEAFVQRHFTRYGQTEYGGLHAWIDPALLGEAAAHRLALGLELGTLGVLAAVARRRRGLATYAFPVELSVYLLGALFLSPVSWYSHYVACLVPYACAAQALASEPWRPGTRTLAVALALAALTTAVSVSATLRSYSPVFLSQAVFFAALARWALLRGRISGAPS